MIMSGYVTILVYKITKTMEGCKVEIIERGGNRGDRIVETKWYYGNDAFKKAEQYGKEKTIS